MLPNQVFQTLPQPLEALYLGGERSLFCLETEAEEESVAQLCSLATARRCGNLAQINSPPGEGA